MCMRIIISLLTLTFCGCGPSAVQLAEQRARQSFRESVAAVKVCTQGATYREFRDKRMILEACYAADAAVVADKSAQIGQLLATLKATDTLWGYQNRFELVPLPSGSDPEWVDEGWVQDPWEAMQVITPEVSLKAGSTWEQRRKDPDFFANNYVKRGLTQIARECEELLR